MTFSAQKCGICFQPPSIILIYRDNSQNKTRQRIMPVRNFSKFSGEGLIPVWPPPDTWKNPLVAALLVTMSTLLTVSREGLCWGNVVSPRSPRLHLHLSSGSLSLEGLERPLGRVWEKMCVWEEVC